MRRSSRESGGGTEVDSVVARGRRRRRWRWRRGRRARTMPAAVAATARERNPVPGEVMTSRDCETVSLAPPVRNKLSPYWFGW